MFVFHCKAKATAHTESSEIEISKKGGTDDVDDCDEETMEPCPPLQYKSEAMATPPMKTFPLPLSYNSTSEMTSRKLLFDDDQSLGLICSSPQRINIPPGNNDDDHATGEVEQNDNSSTTAKNLSSFTHELTCNETFPSPAGFGASFPMSSLDEMNFFQPFQNQFPIDESYSNNLLGSTFIPSPNSAEATLCNVLSASQLFQSTTTSEMQVPFKGPTLTAISCHNSRSNNSTSTAYPVQQVPQSFHMEEEEDAKIEENVSTMNSVTKRQPTIGKTLDSLISASITTKNERPKRSRRVTSGRNLPLRKRHAPLRGGDDDGSQDQQDAQTEMLTTPKPTKTRSSHRMVSRSTSVEKNKRVSMTNVQPSRNRSVRKSSMTRAATRSNRFGVDDMETPPLDGGSLRVIQHFTPKRISPILSEESTLPRTVIIG